MMGVSQKTKRWVVGIVGLIMIAWSMGWVDPIESVPQWWRLVATAFILAVGAAWIAAGKIDSLLPDENGIFLIVFDDCERGGGEIHELNEDQWSNLRVVGGELHPWTNSPERAYECIDYNESRNVAVAGWPETKPASATRAEATVDDVMEWIREVRNDLEPAAAEARFLKRRMRGIIRRLDSEREDAQQKMIDDTMVPSVGDSATISEVIEDEIPDELHPAMLSDSQAEAAASQDSGNDDPDEISFGVLDETNALEPQAHESVATDGGESQ